MRFPTLPLLALAASLGLAACNQAAPVANGEDMTLTNGMTGDAMTNDELATADADAPPVIAAPVVAADAPADQAAPVVEAAQVAATIASDPTVERVADADGWAWRRNGQVIRTASRDGSRISYFRGDEDQPYFVQQGGQSYGYDRSGRVAHVYDRGGHPRAPDASTRSRGDQLGHQARDAHDRARNAPAPDHDGDHNPRSNGQPDQDQHDHGQTGHRQQDRDHGDPRHGTPTSTPTPTATPTPTPSPTPTHHRGDHNGGRQNDGFGPTH